MSALDRSRSPAAMTPPAVVWHDLECGAYRADMALWQELAREADGPLLDVGAGTGRVALALAREGHAMTALDRDPVLLDALRERATRAGVAVETVETDARSFALPRSDYALCLVPMQTIQLLGGTRGRLAFLRRAREHLRTGGTLACAILGEVEPFDCSDGSVGPESETTTLDGRRYVSRAVRVSETRGHVTIERERLVLPADSPAPAWPFPDDGSASGRGAHARPAGERDVIVLDNVEVGSLRHQAEAVGFTALPTREIAATDEHVSSSVVMLGA